MVLNGGLLRGIAIPHSQITCAQVATSKVDGLGLQWGSEVARVRYAQLTEHQMKTVCLLALVAFAGPCNKDSASDQAQNTAAAPTTTPASTAATETAPATNAVTPPVA